MSSRKDFLSWQTGLEDQEVKTAVLERMYKTANKPLDTLMQAIDEQKSVINKLGEKLDKAGRAHPVYEREPPKTNIPGRISCKRN